MKKKLKEAFDMAVLVISALLLSLVVGHYYKQAMYGLSESTVKEYSKD